MDCPHGIPLDTHCDHCEMELEQLEMQSLDDYDRIPFGDAIRFEEEQVWNDISMGEGQDYFNEDVTDGGE